MPSLSLSLVALPHLRTFSGGEGDDCGLVGVWYECVRSGRAGSFSFVSVVVVLSLSDFSCVAAVVAVIASLWHLVDFYGLFDRFFSSTFLIFSFLLLLLLLFTISFALHCLTLYALY